MIKTSFFGGSYIITYHDDTKEKFSNNMFYNNIFGYIEESKNKYLEITKENWESFSDCENIIRESEFDGICYGMLNEINQKGYKKAYIEIIIGKDKLYFDEITNSNFSSFYGNNNISDLKFHSNKKFYSFKNPNYSTNMVDLKLHWNYLDVKNYLLYQD